MTFCTKDRDLYFGDVIDGKMDLSEIGEYALRCIERIPEINDNVAVSESVVMPNHIHMIVIVDNPIEWPDDIRLPQCERLPQCDSPTDQNGNMMHDSGAVGLPYHDSRYQGSRWEEPIIDDSQLDKNEEMQRRSYCCGRLSRIIGQYKSAVTKYANENNIPFAWQPRFHDHIIRNWTEMYRIAQYIQYNPLKWEMDRFYKNGDFYFAAAMMCGCHNANGCHDVTALQAIPLILTE